MSRNDPLTRCPSLRTAIRPGRWTTYRNRAAPGACVTYVGVSKLPIRCLAMPAFAAPALRRNMVAAVMTALAALATPLRPVTTRPASGPLDDLVDVVVP